jgi:hypothetical protein
MPNEPTPIELAAVAELTTPECPWHEGCAGDCEAAWSHARAVIDAVRGPIAAKAQAYVLRDVANWIGARALTGPLTLDEVCAHMRHRADVVEQPLRTPGQETR